MTTDPLGIRTVRPPCSRLTSPSIKWQISKRSAMTGRGCRTPAPYSCANQIRGIDCGKSVTVSIFIPPRAGYLQYTAAEAIRQENRCFVLLMHWFMHTFSTDAAIMDIEKYPCRGEAACPI